MEPIKLLWTGGWDSTFRLLQAIIISRKNVCPYYLVDTERKSVLHEFRAMEKIKNALVKDFPFAKNLLDPLHIYLKSEIPYNEELLKNYDNMMKESAMGIQYKWLANFCEVKGINGMEISFEEHIGMPRYDFIRKHLVLSEINDEEIYKVDSKYSDTNFYKVFHNFNWPIIDISRKKMEEISKQHHFFHILSNTWFCHSPIGETMPCGICTPCMQVVEMGDEKRLPLKSRIRYRFRNVLSSKNFKQKYPKLYRVLKAIK